jgi:predicted transcriptional regulator
MAQPLAEVEFLARSEHRVEALEALAEAPRRRTDLRDLTGASRSTIRRMLCAFEERGWIARDGRRYEATALGAFVATGVTDLLERMETEHDLRVVWEWLPADTIGLDLELFADAVVTVPEFGAPDRPVDRFVELIEETETLRAFMPTSVGRDVGTLFRNAVGGMNAEVLWPSTLIDVLRNAPPEHFEAALESGNLTVLVHDDLPCGCALFDDRVGLAGFDPETGIVRVTVDTDAPEARRWASDLYAGYRREARLLDSAVLVG